VEEEGGEKSYDYRKQPSGNVFVRARAASGGLGPVDSRHARDYRCYLTKKNKMKKKEAGGGPKEKVKEKST
jgi:hypothetical protein